MSVCVCVCVCVYMRVVWDMVDRERSLGVLRYIFGTVTWIKVLSAFFFANMAIINIFTCMYVQNFQRETCCLHLETIFTEDCRGLIESFITWSLFITRHNYLKLNISKTLLPVLDCFKKVCRYKTATNLIIWMRSHTSSTQHQPRSIQSPTCHQFSILMNLKYNLNLPFCSWVMCSSPPETAFREFLLHCDVFLVKTGGTKLWDWIGPLKSKTYHVRDHKGHINCNKAFL